MNPNTFHALLTKTEFERLRGYIRLSNAYQRKIKSDIKKKILSYENLIYHYSSKKSLSHKLQMLCLIVTLLPLIVTTAL